MQGYGPASYGDAFADVYDDWYADVSDVDATVACLVELADGPVLELGVGTGRLAIPLAAAGVEVHGIDTSSAMLDRLRAKDPTGSVTVHLGDMVDDLASITPSAGSPPDNASSGAFSLVFVAYNTLFNLTEPGRQAACFAAVARCLRPGGRFVVEAFVPQEPSPHGSQVTVRTMAADRVVLSVSRHDADTQLADGQFVELSETNGVRMRPWVIRYASPAELDEMAAAAGFELEHRRRGFDDHTFRPDDERHVSVYRR